MSARQTLILLFVGEGSDAAPNHSDSQTKRATTRSYFRLW
jgi:hypothetical protein